VANHRPNQFLVIEYVSDSFENSQIRGSVQVEKTIHAPLVS